MIDSAIFTFIVLVSVIITWAVLISSYLTFVGV